MSSLFLDANILLDFYRFGDDDISEVGKIVELIKGQEIVLFTNSQLESEIERNREKVLSESFSALKANKFSVRAPNYCASFPEYAELREALKVAGERHAALVAALENRVKQRQLPADTLIKTLLANAKVMPIDSTVVGKAKLRVDLGNPPGKKGSLGDAVHWECLLANASGYSFDLVSRDGDFASDLDSGKIKSMLQAEWSSRFGKHSSISLFPSLGAYLRTRFHQIKLSDEAAKNELIERLEIAPNFSTTHNIISELSGFSFFTSSQVIRLFEILVNNSQVGWIATDADIFDFYSKLQNKSYVVPENIQDQAAKLLEVDATDFFLPF